jgi:hypothetical protein
MLFILFFLISFFLLLISYQIFIACFKSHTIEGMTDDDTTTAPQSVPTTTTPQSVPTTTAPQSVPSTTTAPQCIPTSAPTNQSLFNEVQDISGNVAALQDQVNGIIMAQQQYASQITAGGTVPNITGTTTDDTVDTSNLVT